MNELRTLSAFKGLQGGMGAGTVSDSSPAAPWAVPQELGLLRAQVDRAVELTVQHVKKLREMSPLWEMVQVHILICHWLREYLAAGRCAPALPAPSS